MNYSILLADDDDDDYMLLAHHVKQCHQHVTLTHVHNGAEATQQLQNGLMPSLIIVDAQMPVMNGYDLLRWIMDSDAWRQIPVVIWTGSMASNDVFRYYQAGANTLMLKEDALHDVEAFCHHWFKMVQLPPFLANTQA